LFPEIEADFTVKLSDTTAPTNETATFTCEVSRDDAEVEWLTKNETIEPSEKFEISREGRKHSLTVHDLQPEDSGEYTARVGGHDTSASLTVTGNCTNYF
jgi:titin